MFLDIGMGIFISIWTSWFFKVNLNFFLIFMSVIFSLFPDIDFFIELFKHGSVGGKVIREHRQLTHLPITFIPVIMVTFIVFGGVATSILGLNIFSHVLHDSVGLGWGIKWFWPFSDRFYKFFSEKDGKFSSRFLVSWNSEELAEIVIKNGDPDWIRNQFFRFHPIIASELVFLTGSLFALYFYIH